MFAIIEDGSHQHIVREGGVLKVDYRAGIEKGATLTFDRVLLASGGAESQVGRPSIDGATVEAEVLMPTEKGVKLEIQKIRRRKNSRRHTGHRQKYTVVRIRSISVPGLKVAEQTETATADA